MLVLRVSTTTHSDGVCGPAAVSECVGMLVTSLTSYHNKFLIAQVAVSLC